MSYVLRADGIPVWVDDVPEGDRYTPVSAIIDESIERARRPHDYLLIDVYPLRRVERK